MCIENAPCTNLKGILSVECMFVRLFNCNVKDICTRNISVFILIGPLDSRLNDSTNLIHKLKLWIRLDLQHDGNLI